MFTTEEWNKTFHDIVPLLGLVAATFSVALMILPRSSPLGRRAYYQNGCCLVSVRYPGQWDEIRSFVQPDNPDVVAAYSQIGPDVWLCLDYVCQNIQYRHDIGEWWSFPAETIKRGSGDCEDSAILTCSLLRNFTNAYVALGSYHSYGHAWCQVQGETYETTYTLARPVADPENYCPYCMFNDQEVIELWPGALGEIFDLRRDEVSKLNLMTEVVNGFA